MVYWLIGAFLIWVTVPASVIDIFIAPEWFAPHWQCDSLGIPLMQAYRLALPFAAVALIASGLLTFVSTRKRLGGRNIFDLRLRKSARDWYVTLVAVILIAPLACDIGHFFFDALFVQTWTEDCEGRAEEITVSLRRPFFQVLPVVEAAQILWLLHLRAFAVSRRRS
ncbi:MAG: hypothetical protein OIF47_08930 [Marinibacterium sp.]|nr:hypothetical protein [Marinibacterium sp.]